MKRKAFIVVAMIAFVNALGYGIIIPILYTYSKKFGLSDFANGLLFSIFSVCQFIATPVIGRLSDKYGRKPLLVISISGTALSFLTMAFAPSAIFLFIARALDGITAGNIPVASAVISDTTDFKDRAKGFGVIGAAFGFGFVFGPAISALTLGFGIAVPFLIAAAVTFIAILMTIFILPETNVDRKVHELKKGKIFDFKHLVMSIKDPNIGTTLAVSMFYSLAFGMFIYAYQPFTTKVLGISAQQISAIFTGIGIVGLICQGFLVQRVVKIIGDKKSLTASLIVGVFTFFVFGLSGSAAIFITATMINAVANSFVNPMVQTLLSKEVDVHSQGSIQGLNASYVSIGTIVGPIVGGMLATLSPRLPFLLGSAFIVLCVYLSFKILKKPAKPFHEF